MVNIIPFAQTLYSENFSYLNVRQYVMTLLHAIYIYIYIYIERERERERERKEDSETYT